MKHRLFCPPDGEEQIHNYLTYLELKVKKILTPFDTFTQSQIAASGVLLCCTIIAIVMATEPHLAFYYQQLINFPIAIEIGSWKLKEPLTFWINDILLTLFFFIVGLEIKRAFLVGELKNSRCTVLILAAAFGGMLVPSLIFYLINHSNDYVNGWGIPTATDTAFVLGIMSCFRRKLSTGVFTFMVALAIFDDIGATIIVALFYAEEVLLGKLLVALALLGLLVLFNLAGLRRAWPYLVIGIFLWFFTDSAGVHGTIAGIVVAMTIPARPGQGPRHFIRKTRKLVRYFEQRKQKTALVLEDEQQYSILAQIRVMAEDATTPLQRWEHSLERPIALVVLPLFALLNAGISLGYLDTSSILHPLTLGIVLALVLGKPLGIITGAYLMLKLRLGILPQQVRFEYIIATAILGGVGFTMSIFMANATFYTQPETLMAAKVGILLSSILSGIIGIVWLWVLTSRQPTPVCS